MGGLSGRALLGEVVNDGFESSKILAVSNVLFLLPDGSSGDELSAPALATISVAGCRASIMMDSGAISQINPSSTSCVGHGVSLQQ